jgi:ATP-dependent RNA helicase RhlE
LSFDRLGLSPELSSTVTRLGYTQPTPIQAAAIPVILEGRDLLAGAQTGTGKTAAFALPILQQLLQTDRKPATAGKPRSLVLVPTRELAAQVHKAFEVYGRQVNVRSAAIFGGVGMQPQVEAIRRGLDVVVATPGRLLDHMQQRTVNLSGVEILTLDEADRMLDMGFLPALRRILDLLPRQRQTLMFSATLVGEVKTLAAQFSNHAAEIQIAALNSVPATVSHVVHPVVAERKRELLVHLLTKDARQTLVFCRTKHGSDRLYRHLDAAGFAAATIHGNKTQNARSQALRDFKSGRTLVLVATDIAARGLDIEHLPLVINYDLPGVAEDYIHRIGRTGRAGLDGQAISLVSGSDHGLLRDIQRILAHKIQIAPVPGFEVSQTPGSGAVPLPSPRFDGNAPSKHRRFSRFGRSSVRRRVA